MVCIKAIAPEQLEFRARQPAGKSSFDMEDQFAEEGIGPCKPSAAKPTGVILPKTFMHEAGSSMRSLELAQAGGDLLL
jgi:hypothetical protein